ncbi:hypothetical protein HC928_17980 [bacterium]|nr:hypothetical protein [bacterium]
MWTEEIWTGDKDTKLCTNTGFWKQIGDVVVFIINRKLINVEDLTRYERESFGMEYSFMLEELTDIASEEFTTGVLESDDFNYCFEFEAPH